jgi:hypothetical protein
MVIPRIYKSCNDNLRKASIREPKIFVISNYEHEIASFSEKHASDIMTKKS